MKSRCKVGMIFLWTFLLLCVSCRKPAVFYEEVEEESLETELSKEETQETLFVYVCGQVRKPGVYELSEGARIVDAIEAAGGTTKEAAEDVLNLAEKVSDGQKIEVLSREEAQKRKELQASQGSERINLNTASREQLMTLAGIGESKAKAILDYREKKGGFSKVEELMDIPGIKEGVFQKIRDRITV